MVQLGHADASPVALFDALHGFLEHLHRADLLFLPEQGELNRVANFDLSCKASSRHDRSLSLDLEAVVYSEHKVLTGSGLAVWHLNLV